MEKSIAKKEIAPIRMIQSVGSIVIGLLLFITSIVGYVHGPHEPWEMSEFTFLGSFFGGIALVAIGITLLFCERKWFGLVNLSVVLSLLVTLITSSIFHYSFKGIMLFLHFLNPAFAILLYGFTALFTDLKGVKWYIVPVVMIPLVLYMIFALIYGNVTGNHLYDFFNVDKVGAGGVAGYIIGMFFGVLALAYLLFLIARLSKFTLSIKEQKPTKEDVSESVKRLENRE